ncbi:MAG: 2Fe-2S iron-sulfur cluster binding domain-containing protein, partial [Muribaculaceae bacterium]|nr:2Fe-2S iron-sulfur cluster binding domain-containing protein [Muribaculaceae bacterium]
MTFSILNIIAQQTIAGIGTTMIAGVGFFLLITLLLVVVLLIAKKYLVKSGDVEIKINNSREVTVKTGASLLSTMADENIFLPSACGGKGSCGQCRVPVHDGGVEALPTDAVH